MSAESQSEHVWQYAMRSGSVTGRAGNALLNSVNDASGSVSALVVPDLSGDFGSIPSQFRFHGLIASQSQSHKAWPASQPVDGSESQKENMQLFLPSGLQPLISSGPALSQSSHVMRHVTGASPARADATVPPIDSIDDSSFVSSVSEALIRSHEPAPPVTPLKLNNKVVSFRSPTAPPSPPPQTVSRIKSMPPRINRYTPRDVHPSSQDSFAGPPIPQDLNAFARSSRILQNTFISTTATGGVEAVYHRPSNTSSPSLSEPAVDAMTASQSERPEGRTASQIVRAAFDPGLSLPCPEPLVLVRDSQSDHGHSSQDSDRDVNVREPLSSSGSFCLPSLDADVVPTQLNTQMTQNKLQLTEFDTQPTRPLAPSNAVHQSPANTNPGESSSLPVPPHRRLQFSALQAARIRLVDEVVPETPQPTAAPSVQRSRPHSVHPRGSPSGTGGGNVPKLLSKRSHLGGEIYATTDVVGMEIATRRSRPKTAGKDARAEVSLIGVNRLKAGENSHVVPGPMKGAPSSTNTSLGSPSFHEEEQQQMPGHTRAFSRKRFPVDEVVPDSQEEEHQADLVAPPSSPGVSLRELRSRGNPGEELSTLKRVVVRSSPRKGPHVEGVAHTRRRPIDAKGKGKAVQNESEDSISGNGDVSKEVDSRRSAALSVQVHRSKRAPVRAVKTERISASTTWKGSKKNVKMTAATELASGPSTRSKKRKDDAFLDSIKDDAGVPQPTKRQRRAKPTTPLPATSAMNSARVFARRVDKANHYFPGTVTIMAGSAALSRTSTVFRVMFDDGVEGEVDVQFMRRFELENNDNVHIKWPAKHKDCAAEVIGTERWDDELVEVQELHLGPDGDDFEVSSKYISIPEARIRQQFSERRISSRLLRGDLDFDVPFSIPSKNERLAGMGFVITLPDLPRGKRSLEKLITVSGGVVYEEWNSLVSLDGSVELSGRRMAGSTAKVHMKDDVPARLFCLADEARTTPKYLIALALGVPCLSFEWVLERTLKSGEQQIDWPAYVLPAGYNLMTRMPASQAFDRAWWRSSGNALNLISNPPIFKPFLGKSFLCLGTKEFLFSQDTLGIFPKLILAMGALYVEAVTDIAYINKPPAQFDYTVVDDGEKCLEYKSTLSVDAWWVKKCLISGIEGPVPWPDRERLL